MTIPGLKVLALIVTAGPMLSVVTGSPGAQASVVDSALVPGRRVRVFEIAPPGRIPFRIGSLIAIGLDSLAFRWRVTDELVQLPLDSVKQLDISLGRRGNYAREGAITAFAATFVGIIVIVGAASAESGEITQGQLVAVSILGALPSALLGAWVGTLVPKGERWRQVHLPKRAK